MTRKSRSRLQHDGHIETLQLEQRDEKFQLPPELLEVLSTLQEQLVDGDGHHPTFGDVLNMMVRRGITATQEDGMRKAKKVLAVDTTDIEAPMQFATAEVRSLITALQQVLYMLPPVYEPRQPDLQQVVTLTRRVQFALFRVDLWLSEVASKVGVDCKDLSDMERDVTFGHPFGSRFEEYYEALLDRLIPQVRNPNPEKVHPGERQRS